MHKFEFVYTLKDHILEYLRFLVKLKNDPVPMQTSYFFQIEPPFLLLILNIFLLIILMYLNQNSKE